MDVLEAELGTRVVAWLSFQPESQVVACAKLAVYRAGVRTWQS
jgi:hypothetical protein